MKKYFFYFSFLFFLNTLFLSAQERINQFDKDGKRDGIWKKYHSNKLVRYVGQFKNGKEIGVFKFYNMTTNDFPEMVKSFSEKNDSAKVEYYSKKGIVESRGFMLKKHRIGKWNYFNDEGTAIMIEENYENGYLNGLSKIFYKNGKLAEIKNFDNGKLEGNFKRYAINGNLISDLNYLKGKLEGLAKYYNSKGEFTGGIASSIYRFVFLT